MNDTTTATTTDQPKAWVGCLACYNEGRLVGEWLDHDQLDEFCDADTADGIAGLGCRYAASHEETWVMDHECFAGALEGECSPSEALALMGWLDEVADLFGDDVPAAVIVEYIQDDCGYQTVADVDLANVRDAFIGVYDSAEDYAQEAIQDYLIPTPGRYGGWDTRKLQPVLDALPDWLHIDWAWSAKDLLAGEATVEYGGKLYLFASI